MTRNYDRHPDKENSYELDSAIYNKTKPTTNIQLRKKLQQNLALYQRDQPNIIEQEIQTSRRPSDSSPLNVSSKRENARRRGFDLKISNIDTINEKITGLLNMVKKDKQGDRKEAVRQQREENEADRSPSYNITNRFKRYNDSNKADKKGSKEEAPISRLNEANFSDKRRDSYQVENQREEFSRKERDDYSNRELEDPRKLRMKLVQQEDKRRDASTNSKAVNQLRQRKAEDTKVWWDKLLEEEDWQKHSLTIGAKPNYNIQKADAGTEPKKAIDIMIEERRKQRYQYREVEPEEEDRFVQRSRSAIKAKNDQKTRVVNQSHKDSPITKVNNDQSFEDTFSNIKTPLSRNQSRDQRISRFVEISYIEQDLGKQDKINCTAKLIDEQLMRIKSKINDSQANKRRLDSMKPKAQQNFKGKEHIIRIADSVSSQVKLDSHLKQAREAFDKLPGESKWDELEKIAGERGLKIDSRTLKELVTIAPDEHNPFGGQKSSTSIEDLVELLSTAQKNWQNCVLKCSSGRNLKNEGFKVSQLDLNSKGYLGPEDLVCFVNLYANTFYRNRDLALVMRRLQMLQGPSGKNGIEYETFFQAFAV